MKNLIISQKVFFHRIVDIYGDRELIM